MQIDPIGAQLSTLRDAQGRDLLWNGDPAVWTGRAPILFPIVGALDHNTYHLGAETFPLSRHGFARGKLFDVVDTAPLAATFRLRADAATRDVYPFEFELDVHFSLLGAALTVTAMVRNVGLQTLPASLGFHPAFRWPLPYGTARSSHYIEFAFDEPAPIRRLDAEGLLTPLLHQTPIVGRRLALEDKLFKNDVIILDSVRSRSLRYGADEDPKIEMRFPDAAYLGLWTKVGAGFICIEPWQGIADPQAYDGEFTAKPGVFHVAPGEAHSLSMVITLLPHNW